MLKEASRFGRDRADLLLFQMSAMLGHTDQDNRLDHLLGRGHHLSWPLDEALFTAEILPFLFVQHQRSRHWGTESTVTGLMKRGSDRVQQLIADYRKRSAEPGFQPRFGNPEFDTAVRAILTNSSPDDAWPLLHDAISTWQPMSDDHLAPLTLLTDPRTARLITPERGREILSMRRG
ncbi:hypothetical protein GCM10009555_102100 [Acrocarpospora macrocephala]|uniref:Uncharacterized protein n=1 Tax=Acrocarpospora macrocephala TaxID=150177 RepID=A0A5M3WDW5_9ACTN|nr:hypothetical protein [Acrocarpospora macrocephala]GES07134.1 hypothetical protein Amac_007290 [Acrocarpospora macrocephala]